MRALDLLIEPGRTTTTGELADNILEKLAAAGYLVIKRELVAPGGKAS